MKIRKISALFFSMVIAVSVLTGAPASAAAPDEKQGLDVVAVLDASGSMRENGDIPANADVGKKYLVPGVETLIKITSEQDYPVNMGVVIFSLPHNTVTVGEGLWELTDGETPNSASVETLTSSVNIQYQYKSHTDQPNGVEKAIDLLEYGSPSNKKLILLITDGVNDDGSDPNKVNSAEIDAKQPGVIALAKEKGITISTIGFNPYAEDFSKLDEYAKETGGYSIQLDKPEDISDEIIQSVLGEMLGSGTIAAGVTQFEEKINVPKEYDGNSVIALNIIFESPDISGLSMTSPGGVNVLENDADNKLSVSYTTANAIASLAVDGEYGEWILRGEKPSGVPVGYSLIVSASVPTIREEEPAVTTAPVETTTTAAPAVTSTASENSKPATPPPAGAGPATPLPTGAGPEIPQEIFIFGGLGLAAAAVIILIVFAVRAGKPPKLVGELLISYKTDSMNSRPDSVAFDHAKSRQTLYEMFASSAEEIIKNTAADSNAVIKYFKKVTFDATRSHSIKMTNQGNVSVITASDNGYEFTAKFPLAASKESTVTVTFFINFYDTVRAE
jgi:hypothetical protein